MVLRDHRQPLSDGYREYYSFGRVFVLEFELTNRGLLPCGGVAAELHPLGLSRE